MASTTRYLVQIASIPGNQVGQRAFEQSRYLHDLLINTLTNDSNEKLTNKKQINVLRKLIPDHEIVLPSGFSQTYQWGLEPNMYLEVHGNENQARLISALFGQAFCQDGVGIDGLNTDDHIHSVLIINGKWKNDDEKIKFASAILRNYPQISAQIDTNGQLTFHDYTMSSSHSFSNIISLIKDTHDSYSVEEKKVKSELIDRNEYESILLTSIQSTYIRRIFNILQYEHARLFAGYACGPLTLPRLSLKQRSKRRQNRKDICDINKCYSISPSHLCSLMFTSYRSCMCLTDDSCFCYYTLVFPAYLTSSHS